VLRESGEPIPQKRQPDDCVSAVHFIVEQHILPKMLSRSNALLSELIHHVCLYVAYMRYEHLCDALSRMVTARFLQAALQIARASILWRKVSTVEPVVLLCS
jgi:hypothetical protein